MISPSLLSSNFLNLENEIEMLNNSDAEFIHLDIMDGVFVPNITFGFQLIKNIKKISKKLLDVHLMIVNPDRYLKEFKDAGADILTVHYEACTHLDRTLTEIKRLQMNAGVAINPHTSVDLLKDIVTISDLILIMSVNPGFGGQTFIENSYNKVKEAKSLIKSKKMTGKCLIEVDGGVTLSNAKKLYKSGADIMVAGNTVFNSPNPSETISKLLQQRTQN